MQIMTLVLERTWKKPSLDLSTRAISTSPEETELDDFTLYCISKLHSLLPQILAQGSQVSHLREGGCLQGAQ